MVDVVEYKIKKEEVIMPRGDKTGPEGLGPLTGRRMGYCTGNDNPGFANLTPGFGRRFSRGSNRWFGRGRGMSFGGGYGYFPDENIPNVTEKTALENEIRILKDHLASLEKRLSESKE